MQKPLSLCRKRPRTDYLREWRRRGGKRTSRSRSRLSFFFFFSNSDSTSPNARRRRRKFFSSLPPLKKISPSSTSMATRRTPGAGLEGGCGGVGTMGCCLAAAAAPLDDDEDEEEAAADAAAADGAIGGGNGDDDVELRPAELDFATSKPPALEGDDAPAPPRPLGGRDRRACARTATPRTACCCCCRRATKLRVERIDVYFFNRSNGALFLYFLYSRRGGRA